MNALVLALMGAVLIPALVSRVTELRIRHVVTSGALTTGLLSGFAPYPSMDLVSGGLILLGILLLDLRRPWWNALGGVLLGAAVNLRPAHVAAAVAMVVVYAVLRRWRVVMVVAGVAVGLVPQVLYNAHRGLPLSAVPRDARLISEIQLLYSGYGVRSDTVAYLDQDPVSGTATRRWPAPWAIIPTSTSDLLKVFVQNIPTSAGFALEKLVGTLQWSWQTPYAGPGTPGWTVLGVLTLLVSMVGLAGLLVSCAWPSARPRSDGRRMLVAVVGGRR